MSGGVLNLMHPADEYDRKAVEIDELADRLPVGPIRDGYRALAQQWRDLAQGRRARKL